MTECRHGTIVTWGTPDNRLWACASCSRRFYPACETCVDVGHRNETHQDAARAAVPDAATMARIYRVAPGEDSEGETWMAAYADLAAICAAEHAAVPDATAWRRTNEQEGHPDLPESLLYDPLSGDGDFQYLSLEDRLDRIAQHHESVGFHQGYAAARSERTAVPDARMLAEAMFNADPDAWKGRTDTDLLDDALDLAGELTRLAARSERAAVPDTGLREALVKFVTGEGAMATDPDGDCYFCEAEGVDFELPFHPGADPDYAGEHADWCLVPIARQWLAALPAPDPRP